VRGIATEPHLYIHSSDKESVSRKRLARSFEGKEFDFFGKKDEDRKYSATNLRKIGRYRINEIDPNDIVVCQSTKNARSESMLEALYGVPLRVERLKNFKKGEPT
jgi:hypothetical protein